MKITWLTRWDPTLLTNGASIYTRGLLEGLRDNSAEITVIARREGGVEGRVDLEGIDLHLLTTPLRRKNLSLFSLLQSDAFVQASQEFATLAVSQINKATDAVVFDFFTSGWLIDQVRHHCSTIGASPAYVYVAHNHEKTLRASVAEGYSGNPLMKLALHYDALKAALLERKLENFADIITAITPDDTAKFERDAPGKTILLTPGYNGAVVKSRDISASTKRRVIMMGSLDWVAKRESLLRFARAAERPFRDANIELLVVGKVDGSFAELVKASSSICSFAGFVEDPSSLIADSRIGLMADELGGGFKLKYLSYIFQQIPIATIRSQAKGFPFNVEDAMILGEDVQELVRRIVSSIDDFSMLNALKDFSLSESSGKFDWKGRGESLMEAISNLLASRP